MYNKKNHLFYYILINNINILIIYTYCEILLPKMKKISLIKLKYDKNDYFVYILL